jgi:hypothetical protein
LGRLGRGQRFGRRPWCPAPIERVEVAHRDGLGDCAVGQGDGPVAPDRRLILGDAGCDLLLEAHSRLRGRRHEDAGSDPRGPTASRRAKALIADDFTALVDVHGLAEIAGPAVRGLGLNWVHNAYLPRDPGPRPGHPPSRCRKGSPPSGRDIQRFHSASTTSFGTCLSGAPVADIPLRKRPPEMPPAGLEPATRCLEGASTCCGLLPPVAQPARRAMGRT